MEKALSYVDAELTPVYQNLMDDIDNPEKLHMIDHKLQYVEVKQAIKVDTLESMIPIGRYIYQLAALKMIDLKNTRLKNKRVLSVHTDAWYFQGEPLDTRLLSDKIGGLKQKEVGPEKVREPRALDPFDGDVPPETPKCTPKLEWHEFAKHQDDLIKDTQNKQNKILEKIKQNKGFCLLGRYGSGKSTMVKYVRAKLDELKQKYIVLTPTNKSAILVDGITVDRGIPTLGDQAWIIVDEISMVHSKWWNLLWQKRNKYKFILVGDFRQIGAVKDKLKKQELRNSNLLKELAEQNLCFLKGRWRMKDDPRADELMDDLDLIDALKWKKVNFKKYGTLECERSLAFTNETVNHINAKMHRKEGIEIDGFGHIYPGLPLVCIDHSHKTQAINQESFIVKHVYQDRIVISSELRKLELRITHNQLAELFTLAYCMTVHKAQGSTFNFPYTIYDLEIMPAEILIVAMSRTTRFEYVNFAQIVELE
jgi:energy-coupling factor transporter ATP-binding protein EcfA2